jgi:hypothetical protein
VCTVDPVVKRLAITLLISQVTLLAQTPTGTIIGTVTDPTGAVFSSAKITIVNIVRTAGSFPWVAHVVINDRGAAGQRTGDGAFFLATVP